MFTVTQTIQSTRADSTDGPVDVQWYKGDNRALALAALVQAGAGSEDATTREWYRVLSVQMTVEA